MAMPSWSPASSMRTPPSLDGPGMSGNRRVPIFGGKMARRQRACGCPVAPPWTPCVVVKGQVVAALLLCACGPPMPEAALPAMELTLERGDREQLDAAPRSDERVDATFHVGRVEHGARVRCRGDTSRATPKH